MVCGAGGFNGAFWMLVAWWVAGYGVVILQRGIGVIAGLEGGRSDHVFSESSTRLAPLLGCPGNWGCGSDAEII